MQKLLHVRAWSRACQLAIQHYPVVAGCADHSLRTGLQQSLISIPCSLAAGVENHRSASTESVFSVARRACAELNTRTYIARELGYVSEFAATCLIQESLDLMELVEGLQTECEQARKTSTIGACSTV